MLILKIMIRCDKLRGNGLNDKLNVYLYIYICIILIYWNEIRDIFSWKYYGLTILLFVV